MKSRNATQLAWTFACDLRYRRNGRTTVPEEQSYPWWVSALVFLSGLLCASTAKCWSRTDVAADTGCPFRPIQQNETILV